MATYLIDKLALRAGNEKVICKTCFFLLSEDYKYAERSCHLLCVLGRMMMRRTLLVAVH